MYHQNTIYTADRQVKQLEQQQSQVQQLQREVSVKRILVSQVKLQKYVYRQEKTVMYKTYCNQVGTSDF